MAVLEVHAEVEAGWPDGDWQGLTARAVEAAVLGSPHPRFANAPFVTEVAVRLTSDDEVRRLNKAFRGKDAATDVLSFPMIQPDRLDASANTQDGEVILGDIALAVGVVTAAAEAKGVSVPDHVTHLVVHGTLHLLGFEHDDPGQADAMEDVERAALERLGVADPYADA